jgi:hypothetical protein
MATFFCSDRRAPAVRARLAARISGEALTGTSVALSIVVFLVLLSEQCLPKGQVPADLVGLAMFLATSTAAFITGQPIACDGGLAHNS